VGYRRARRDAASDAAFQGKHGLVIDGLIGPETWAALDAA
jgi:peptidoglycan hydrolase-like protein with peptidoglycan-binding domain